MKKSEIEFSTQFLSFLFPLATFPCVQSIQIDCLLDGRPSRSFELLRVGQQRPTSVLPGVAR